MIETNELQPNGAEYNNEGDLSLQEILRVVLSHLRLIGTTVVVFLGLALLYAFFWPPTYEAITTVKVPDASGSPTGMLKELVPYSGSGDPIQTYVEICHSENVAQRVIASLQLSSRPEYEEETSQVLTQSLLGRVTATNVLKSNLLSIKARAGNAQDAADLANAWAKAFIETNLDLSHKGAESKRIFLEEQVKQIKQHLENPDLRLNDESKADEVMYTQLLADLQQARLAETVDDTGIVVVDSAQKPLAPISPRKTRSLLLALLLALAAGIQAAFLLEKFQDRVKSEDVLKRVSGLPNYAVVPDFRDDYPEGLSKPDYSQRFSPKFLIHNPVFEHAFYRESFKVLRTNLTFALADKPLQVIAVLSPGPEEGKTLVNSNLAISLAQGGKKVLLVDTDFRKSSVRKSFGLENGMETGLPLALTGQKPWKELVRPSGVENLDLLPNTVTPPNPAELLGSAALKKLIGEMKTQYDFVVFDGAPILAVTDSVVLSTHLDGVVLLACFDQTRSSAIGHALEHLHRVGANVVGTVLNYVPVKKGLYGYGYGYGYNYGYGKYHDAELAGKNSKK